MERAARQSKGGLFCWMSLESDNRWGVGQLADRLTVNQEVVGSSPTAPALVTDSYAITYAKADRD